MKLIASITAIAMLTVSCAFLPIPPRSDEELKEMKKTPIEERTNINERITIQPGMP